MSGTMSQKINAMKPLDTFVYALAALRIMKPELEYIYAKNIKKQDNEK